MLGHLEKLSVVKFWRYPIADLSLCAQIGPACDYFEHSVFEVVESDALKFLEHWMS